MIHETGGGRDFPYAPGLYTCIVFPITNIPITALHSLHLTNSTDTSCNHLKTFNSYITALFFCSSILMLHLLWVLDKCTIICGNLHYGIMRRIFSLSQKSLSQTYLLLPHLLPPPCNHFDLLLSQEFCVSGCQAYSENHTVCSLFQISFSLSKIYLRFFHVSS